MSSSAGRFFPTAVPPAREAPFTEVFSEGDLVAAVQEIEATWKERIFTPLVTLWVFLGQALAADQSCRAAVARLIAHHSKIPSDDVSGSAFAPMIGVRQRLVGCGGEVTGVVRQ